MKQPPQKYRPESFLYKNICLFMGALGKPVKPIWSQAESKLTQVGPKWGSSWLQVASRWWSRPAHAPTLVPPDLFLMPLGSPHRPLGLPDSLLGAFDTPKWPPNLLPQPPQNLFPPTPMLHYTKQYSAMLYYTTLTILY